MMAILNRNQSSASYSTKKDADNACNQGVRMQGHQKTQAANTKKITNGLTEPLDNTAFSVLHLAQFKLSELQFVADPVFSIAPFRQQFLDLFFDVRILGNLMQSL